MLILSAITKLLVEIAILAVSTAVLQWIMNTINNKVTYQVVRDVRNQAFIRIQKLPLKYMDAHSYGEIVSRVIADVDQFADGLLMGFTQLFTGAATIIGTLGFMLSVDVKYYVCRRFDHSDFIFLWRTLLPAKHLRCFVFSLKSEENRQV